MVAVIDTVRYLTDKGDNIALYMFNKTSTENLYRKPQN